MPPKKSVSAKLAFQPRQRVFAKMPGFSAWPAFVVPQEDIPDDVLEAKKRNNKTPYCVIFIPDGDYYWMSEKGLTELTEEKLSKALKDVPLDIKKKMKNLKGKIPGKQSSYKQAIAATDGLDYDTFRDFLIEINGVEEEDDDDKEEEEEVEEEQEEEPEEELEEPEEPESKPKPIKKEKIIVRSKSNKREYDDEAEDGDVEESYEDEDSVQLKKQSRNGGRRSRSSSVSTKNTLTTATNGRKKRRLTGDNSSNTKTSEKSTDSNIIPIPSIKKIKSETSDDDNQSHKSSIASVASNNHNNKPTVSDKEKNHQLWLCRVKLQKTLIQRNQATTPKDTTGLKPPTADELSTARLILHRLQDFPITAELLRKSKLHKVLRCIIKDPTLKYPESFKLHDRCQEVLDVWKEPIEQLKLEKQLEYEDNKLNPSHHSHGHGHGLDAANRKAIHNQDDSEVSGLEQSIPELEAQGKKSEELKPASITATITTTTTTTTTGPPSPPAES
ncbi:putative protein of unknown function [Candida albicans P60002]|nr:putative protein of unknown function [Candida albicans P60002]